MYATQQDIIELYGSDELHLAFDRDGSGTVDPGAVDAALQRAGDEIDTYLAAVVELPLATVPAVLKQLCVDIALYKGSVGPAQTDEKRTRYEDATRLLRDLAAGRASLNLPAREQPEPRDGVGVDAPDKLFGRDVLELY